MKRQEHSQNDENTAAMVRATTEPYLTLFHNNLLSTSDQALHKIKAGVMKGLSTPSLATKKSASWKCGLNR